MSDSGYSPYADLSEDELIQMLAGYQGSTLPGKTPAAQLNYYQDLVSTLGFDPVQQTGLGWGEEEQASRPKTSLQRTAYGANPIYKEVFDRIDSGMDPTTAYEETKAAHDKELDWDANGKDIASAAKDYAFERAKNIQTEEETAAAGQSYTRPDGSKYKNAPLGGNGIFETASEYDLLGAPTVDDLVSQYAQSRRKTTPGQGGPGSSIADVFKHQAEIVNGPDDVAFNKDFGIRGTAGDPRKQGPTSDPTMGRRSKNAGRQQAIDAGYTGDKITDNVTKMKLTETLNKKKGTQVRSDANTNAMRRILALRTVLGG